MDLDDDIIIALALIVEQQSQELLHVMQLIHIFTEEDEDEDPLLDSRLWVQRSAWAFVSIKSYYSKTSLYQQIFYRNGMAAFGKRTFQT